MYFIGSGALLTDAVRDAQAAGFRVDGACCRLGDATAAHLRRLGVPTVEALDPNDEPWLVNHFGRDKIVFSVNNPYVLGDELLSTGARVFNIHNGPTQRYRGVGEVCLFAAMCAGDRTYGPTLHRLLPGDAVDAGPVVAQLSFEIVPDETFAVAFRRSLGACRLLFRQGLRAVADGAPGNGIQGLGTRTLRYGDVAGIYAAADPSRRAKAADLGPYAGLLPKLRLAVERAQREAQSLIG